MLLLVSAALWFDAGNALADAKTVTIVVPGFQSGGLQVGEQAQPRPNALLPASEAFTLRIPAPSSGEISGTAQLWPEALDDGCKSGPNSQDRRQTYELELTDSSTSEGRALTAAIPPLEVDQAFCFRFRVARAPTSVELARIAHDAVSTVVSIVIGGAGGDKSPCPAGATETRALMLRVLERSKTGFVGDLGPAAEVAQPLYAVNVSANCVAAVNALKNHAAEALASLTWREKLAVQERALKSMPIVEIRSPRVAFSGKVVPLHTLIQPKRTRTELSALLEQLDDSAKSRLASSAAALAPWRDATHALVKALETNESSTLGSEQANAFQQRLMTADDALSKPLEINLKLGVRDGTLSEHVMSAQLDQLAAGLAAVLPVDVIDPAKLSAAKQTLEAVVATRAASAEAVKAHKASIVSSSAANELLRTSLTSVLTSTDVQNAIDIAPPTIACRLRSRQHMADPATSASQPSATKSGEGRVLECDAVRVQRPAERSDADVDSPRPLWTRR